jgi:NAD-dependent protein deacetylase/lipoamidase
MGKHLISEQLIKKLRNSTSVAVLTGAGISAESGVPTFRGEDGLWKKFRPEELANFQAFVKNPDLVWEWYQYRRRIIESIRPNPGHYAIAEMEKHHENFAVITQNVDNLHIQAGSRNVHELHGNIMRNYCIECGKEVNDDRVFQCGNVPHCTCGGLVRPDVVWFGEMLPEESWRAGVNAAENSQIFFAIGTSAVVYPAADIPRVAKRAGAYLVEINLERTDLSPFADEVLLGKSGEILPELVKTVYL